MNDKLQEQVHVNKVETMIKVTELNNPESYVLTHNRFITLMVLL